MLRLEEEMDRITRNQTFGMFVAATRILVLLAVLGSLAEAWPPPNASALLGTWVNVKNTGSFGLARIVITDVSGDFEVHPYGFCSPTPCDWGMHPAFRFSNSVVVGTAVGFNAVFGYILKSVYMQGHLIQTPTGQALLEVTTQSRFVRLDSRYDYEKTERFQLK